MVVLLWSGVTLSLRRCPQARAASGWVRDARGELLAQAVSVAVDPVLSDAAPSQPVDADAGEADRCVHRRMPEELSLVRALRRPAHDHLPVPPDQVVNCHL